MIRIDGLQRHGRFALMLALALLMIGGVATAQERGERRGGGGRDTEQMLARMTEKLSLSEEQQAKVSKIYEARDAEAREMMSKTKDSDLSREDRRKQFLSFRDETNAKVAKVLDEEQGEKFKEMLSQRQAMMEKRQAEKGEGAGRQRRGAGEKPQRKPAATD